MATRLDSYDFSPYPYTEWFDGGIWRLHTSVDFKVKPSTMAAYLRAEARERKVSIEIKVENTGDVVMQSGPPVIRALGSLAVAAMGEPDRGGHAEQGA